MRVRDTSFNTRNLLTGVVAQKVRLAQGRAWWLMPVIPALWGAAAGGSLEGRSSRPARPTRRNSVSIKTTKISWAWWWMPVIPATWKAEAGEWLEPRRWRLQWAEIAPLHSSLGDRARLHLKTKINEKEYHKLNYSWFMFPKHEQTRQKIMSIPWKSTFRKSFYPNNICLFVFTKHRIFVSDKNATAKPQTLDYLLDSYISLEIGP